MSAPTSIVVVGAGLAGASAVEQLRAEGYDGDVALVGAEPHLPYDRPPLSKQVLLGDKSLDEVPLHDAGWYAERDVDVRTGSTVTGLDLRRRVVVTGDAEIRYDRLLLATGSEPHHLPVHDVPAAYLRTRDDAQTLLEALGRKARLTIVGAGWIGLEVAAAARTAGCDVTVIEPQEKPLRGVVGRRLGEEFASLHREHGVDLRLGASFEGVSPVPADLVLVAVGAAPRLDLAREAGLAVDGGVLVDATLRTSDPNVYAAGDIAAHDHPRLGRLRVEHWDNAIEQGKAAARNMLGAEAAYERAPYFFTDQYDLGMEYVGHAPRDLVDSVVVRGDLAARQAVVLWHDRGRVVAGMHLNEWDSTDHLRALLGRTLDPELLVDSDDADLAQLVRRTT